MVYVFVNNTLLIHKSSQNSKNFCICRDLVLKLLYPINLNNQKK